MGRQRARSASTSSGSGSDKDVEKDLDALLYSDDESDDGRHSSRKTHKSSAVPAWVWALVGLLIVLLVGGGLYWMYKSGKLGGGENESSSQVSTESGLASGLRTAEAVVSSDSGSDDGSSSSPSGTSTMSGAESSMMSSNGSASSSGSGSSGVPTPGATPAPSAATTGPAPAGSDATAGSSETETLKPVFTNQVGGRVDETPTPTEETKESEKPKPTPTWEDTAPDKLPLRMPDGVTKVNVNFADAGNDKSLVQVLEAGGLFLKQYEVASDPRSYAFDPANAALEDKQLKLTVTPPENDQAKVKGAQVATKTEDVIAAMLTWKTKLTTVQGITQAITFGNFFEMSMRSSYYSGTGGVRGITPGIMVTINQGDNTVVFYVDYAAKPGEFFKPDEAAHEYTVYWTPKFIGVYIDKELTKSRSGEMPQKAGGIAWNVFSNGNPRYSGGPPSEPASQYIESISGWIYSGGGSTGNSESSKAVSI